LETVPPTTMLHGGIRDAYHSGMNHVSGVDGVSLLARSKAASDASKTHGETVVLTTTVAEFLKSPDLAEEVFGPFSVLISAQSITELEEVARRLDGQLTATVQGTLEDLAQAGELLRILERKAGRLIINGFPTGVEVCPSMNHGGPYPATTDVRFTSVGTAALERFVRPVCYQDFPDSQLPDALKAGNPLKLRRLVNGVME
jgi:NADP-dependent aldehyde dehydrogenase